MKVVLFCGGLGMRMRGTAVPVPGGTAEVPPPVARGTT